MDARILFVLVAVVLVYWLIRNRLTLQSHSATGTHPHRRSSDRRRSGEQGQRALHKAEPDRDTPQTVDSATMAMTETVASAPANQAMRTMNAPAVASVAATSRQESLSASVASAAPPSGSRELQNEITLLTEQLQRRDRSLTRNRHAMEEVDKLKRQLFDKGREMEMLKQACARSDAALAHYRTDAQRTAMLEQQLAEARDQLKRREQELQQLRALPEAGDDTQEAPQAAIVPAETSVAEDMDRTQRNIQLSKQQLATELKEAERKAIEASQNALELRRIRGELEAVCSDHANAKNLIAELQRRVREQQEALETARQTEAVPAAEISALKQTLQERQSQNDALRQQLARLSRSSTSPEGGQ